MILYLWKIFETSLVLEATLPSAKNVSMNLFTKAPMPSAALSVFPTNLLPNLWPRSMLPKAVYIGSTPMHFRQSEIKLNEQNPIVIGSIEQKKRICPHECGKCAFL